MPEKQRTVAAKCRVCGRQLTIEEFRACDGRGHYCKAHLTAAAPEPPKRPKRTRSSSASTGGRRGRHVTESGAIEYSCRAQFARDAAIRRGRLTSEHASCSDGGVVFVSNKVGHGPSEIVTLFIKDPDGRRLAERSGYTCSD